MREHKRARRIAGLADPYCVRKGKKFRLEDVDPGDTSGVKCEAHALTLLEQGTGIVRDRQEKLYAQDNWALLRASPYLRGDRKVAMIGGSAEDRKGAP
jgi:hypothetical protein